MILVGGCTVNVRGRKRPLVRQERFQGEIETVVEHRRDEQGTDVNRRESDTLVFEERVRVKTRGDVYHPDLLTYDIGLGAGLAQQRIDADEVSGWDSDTLEEYSVSGQLFRAKPLSATAHASKMEDLIARQFLGSLQADRQSEGASVFLRSQSWPMMLQYSRSDTSQDSLTSPATDFFRREDERIRYSVDHDFSDSSHIHFDFGRAQVQQESVGAVVNTDTDTYSLLHDQAFGDDDQHRLDSSFNYIDQTGTFEFETLRWQERLRLQHTASLLTEYDFRLVDFERETVSSQELRGQAGVEHRLYDSLVSRADAFVSETDFAAQGTLSQYGGIAAFNYRKDNAWGTLFSTYTANLTRTDQSGGSGTGIVIDEAHTATDVVPVELNHTNIDVSTIRVREIGGLLFQEGDDYTITVSNGRVFLSIITVGGLIPPNFTEGQQFLVDYEFFVEPQRRENTLRQAFTLRERFDNGLSVFYAHRRQDEGVSSTTQDLIPDEYTVNTVAADYTNKGLYLLAEYSDEDSTVIPSTSTRLEGRYQWLMGTGTSASVRVLNRWLQFEPPDERDVTLFQAGMEMFSRLDDRYSISASADYRDEDDTRFGATRGVQVDAELSYQYRQFSATLGTELRFLNRRDDEINSVFVYLQLRRRF